MASMQGIRLRTRLQAWEAWWSALQPKHGSLAAYTLALLLMAIALLVRLAIAPVHAGLQYVAFFPAVTLVAIIGGFGPGLFATIIGVLLASFIFTPPYYSFTITAFQDSFWSSMLFLFDGVLVSLSITSMYRYRDKFRAKLEEAERNEAHVRSINRELDALNLQLVARTREANAANQAKSAFVATMSHEIRTPLNAVLGLARLLSESPLDRRQRDWSDKIQLSAHALRTLIDDILDFSKIEAGGLQLEEAPFSLNAVLRTTAATLSIGLRDKPVEALFDVGHDVPDMLLGDAMRVQQILINLTSNAGKFTATGAIVITVRRLAGENGVEMLQFAVRDTGIGIPPERLATVFDAFTQADLSICRQYGGTGLGLAICSRLVALMGGRIAADSSEGEGSEFRFTVPLRAAEAAASPADNPTDLSILIADDHPLARQILQQTCRNFHWQATAVDSAAACLEELQRSAAEGRDYDVLLLDWHMPEMDGLQMLRHAQQVSDIRLPLVILMAPTYELEQAVAASDDLYLDSIVTKPLTPAALLDAVQRAYTGDAIELIAPTAPDRRLAGVRLLVAEDNELNQQVIEQILTHAGAEVVIVNNGRAAVLALQSPDAHFDAVLMDIQMPIMDGYEATRVIREELALHDLPIIAVTAYAQPEACERGQRVGINGHIVKPINVEDLLELIRVESRVAIDEAGGITALATDFELPELDITAGLIAFNGDQKAYGDMLRKFALSHGGDAREAHRLFRSGDHDGAARLVHGLCGMASFLRATAVARLAGGAEQALMNGVTDRLPALFEELEAAMHALGTHIDQFDGLASVAS